MRGKVEQAEGGRQLGKEEAEEQEHVQDDQEQMQLAIFTQAKLGIHASD